MDAIDLRSDTVTWPTPNMRHAMAEANVGDDVYGEDPTVNELQEKAARRFGKEAALLVTSGSMGNVICMLTHCGRGDRAIVGDKSHVNLYESGNPAALGGIQPWAVPVQPDGTLRLEDLRAGITRATDSHFPYTKVISLENTQGSLGGQPVPAAYIREVAALAQENNLKLHIDGARIFNAAAALNTDVAELAETADSLTFCLSKGLCAPVGSVIVGSKEFIARAHRIRKMLGGGMRQAGVIAAAGIVALEEMTERLSEDHVNAKTLAEGLAAIPGFLLDPERVKSNMVFFDLAPDAKLDAKTLSDKLRTEGILINPTGTYRFRAVTHYWIKPEHIERVLKRVRFYFS
jgi:threonine aldolase